MPLRAESEREIIKERTKAGLEGRGVIYQRVQNGEFKVVPPPVGAAVPELPAATRPVLTQRQRVLESDGTYYLEMREADGILWYTVIGEKDKADLDTAAPF